MEVALRYVKCRAYRGTSCARMKGRNRGRGWAMRVCVQRELEHVLRLILVPFVLH